MFVKCRSFLIFQTSSCSASWNLTALWPRPTQINMLEVVEAVSWPSLRPDEASRRFTLLRPSVRNVSIRDCRPGGFEWPLHLPKSHAMSVDLMFSFARYCALRGLASGMVGPCRLRQWLGDLPLPNNMKNPEPRTRTPTLRSIVLCANP